MRTIRMLIALPIALAALALQVFLMPAIVLLIVWAIWGTHSTIFDWTLLACLGWVYLEWRSLQRAGSGGRRTLR